MLMRLVVGARKAGGRYCGETADFNVDHITEILPMSLPAYEKMGAFYLGRKVDDASGKDADELVMYDARDLTTHAVCVGMTGSRLDRTLSVLSSFAAPDAVVRPELTALKDRTHGAAAGRQSRCEHCFHCAYEGCSTNVCGDILAESSVVAEQTATAIAFVACHRARNVQWSAACPASHQTAPA
jgi:hypothetical protein